MPPSLEKDRKLWPFILLIGSLVFMFGVGEIVFQTIGIPMTAIEPVSSANQLNVHWGIEPKPDIKYEEYGFWVSTNKNAMYGPEVPKSKKGMRVAYLGDSYTVGPGISFEKNYPTLVTQALKTSSGSEADMVIGGIAGSSPLSRKLFLRKRFYSTIPIWSFMKPMPTILWTILTFAIPPILLE